MCNQQSKIIASNGSADKRHMFSNNQSKQNHLFDSGTVDMHSRSWSHFHGRYGHIIYLDLKIVNKWIAWNYLKYLID